MVIDEVLRRLDLGDLRAECGDLLLLRGGELVALLERSGVRGVLLLKLPREADDLCLCEWRESGGERWVELRAGRDSIRSW